MRNTVFGGMIPKVHPQSLPTNASVLAENCLLHGGKIEPLYAPKPIAPAVDINGRPTDTVKTLLVTENMNIGFPTFTPTAYDILKRAGEYSFLFVRDGKLHRSSPSWILDHQGPVELGVCRPTQKPALTLTSGCESLFEVDLPGCLDEVIGEGDCDGEEQYVMAFQYTFVTPCQEESAPSEFSDVIKINAENGVFLMNPTEIPDNVAEIRWYVLMTGDGTSNPFYIGSSTPAQLGFNYCHRRAEFGEILQSQEYHHPEPCLEGVATLGDNITVVWHTNEIWLSEPRQPHAYPYRYRMTLDPDVQIKTIVTMQNMNESDPYWYAIILTDGRPYLLRADKPEDAHITRVAREAPCVNPAGIFIYQDKVFFPSVEGILAMAQSSIVNVTAPFCTIDEYQKYDPSELILGVYLDRLIALHPGQNGFMLNLNESDSPYQNDFTELTPTATAIAGFHKDLYVTGRNGTVYQWEASPNRLVAFWRSKDYIQSGLWHGTAAKVVSPHMRDVIGEGRHYLSLFLGDKKCRGYEDLERFLIQHPDARRYIDILANYTVEFFIYNDGELFYKRPVATNRSIRIKRNNRRMVWGYAVRTQVPVVEIHIQTSKDDLTQEGGHA